MVIILLLGFPLPGDPHVGERYDTCVQDFSPGGRRCVHLSGSGSPNQHHAEEWACTDLLDVPWKVVSSVIKNAEFVTLQGPDNQALFC